MSPAAAVSTMARQVCGRVPPEDSVPGVAAGVQGVRGDVVTADPEGQGAGKLGAERVDTSRIVVGRLQGGNSEFMGVSKPQREWLRRKSESLFTRCATHST